MYSRMPEEWFHQSRRLSTTAQALHWQVMSFCQLIRLDGRLPKADMIRATWIPAADIPDAVDELIAYGMWEDHGEAYWVWADPTIERLQYTAEQQETHRRRNRDKQRRKRENAKQKVDSETHLLTASTQPNPTQDITGGRTPGYNGVSHGVTNGVTDPGDPHAWKTHPAHSRDPWDES